MIVALSGNPYFDYSPGLFSFADNGARFGLGAAPTAGQLVAAGATGATTGLATKSLIAGSVAGGLATAALFDPEPISKAILAISAAFVGPLMQAVNRGCGNTCIVASQAANQATVTADQIKQQYWATPTPRPKSLQQAALTALSNIANALQQACSDPALGDAGKRCISERLVEGGSAPWCPNGGCDFWTTYYRPIERDPNVVDDTNPVASLTAAAQSGAAALGIPANYAVPAALALALVLTGVLLL
jgi:hypothetical protein